MKKWTLNSWRDYPVKHIPKYEDEKELAMVLKKVGSFPPLVFAGETRALKKSLAQVVEGKAFLLQGGDCAESFAEFHPDNIRDTFKVIFDLILLGVGNDGHIASLFKNNINKKTNNKVSFIKKKDFSRITLTLKCLNNSKSIFLWAPGKRKSNIVKKMLSDKKFKYPVSFLKKKDNFLFHCN